MSIIQRPMAAADDGSSIHPRRYNHSMSLPELAAPTLIQDQSSLQELIAKLGAGKLLAVDTESNSLHAYQERVCLIQFSTREEDFLVDPLAIDDLSPLAPIFADPKIEKIYHAAEYDVMTLKRDFSFEQRNLFDTYIAVRTLGWDHSGLADILETVFDVKLKKRYQRANWGKRPLPKEMLDYARFDTHYLIPLRQRLVQSLKAQGKLAEASEAFHLQTLVPPHENGFDPLGFWGVGDTRKLNGRQAAILRELYLFREEEAQRQDVPPFKVFGNQSLLALAEAAPEDAKEFEQVKGMSGRRLSRYGGSILQAIRRGEHADEPGRPHYERPPDDVLERYETLRTWRKLTARDRHIDSDIVLPRDTLWDIARANPSDAGSLKEVMQPLEWRFETYGETILQLLTG
jgi:ribonuclease D